MVWEGEIRPEDREKTAFTKERPFGELRSAEHKATRLTPAELLFGRTLRLPCDILFGRASETPSSPNEYMNNLEARLESIHAFARERIKLASDERMKTVTDSQATDHQLRRGDLVWM
ncbi:hypothetical protein HNY73_017862 [Argiope bruennichi]|uniref:Uncharacterized protein n=1 Tax=Argiope bruennichi TaxID=94029 RepID=A0A8T0EC55_ARGBR|nr:hypothetical protein HNY73_017862 [Argiope bruennichi]